MGEREDKMETTMNNYQEALQWMDQGKKVYNTNWLTRKVASFAYIYYDTTNKEYKHENGISVSIDPIDMTTGEWKKLYDECDEIFDSLAIAISDAKYQFVHDHGYADPSLVDACSLLLRLKNDYIYINKARIDWLNKLEPKYQWVKDFFYNIVEGRDILLPVNGCFRGKDKENKMYIEANITSLDLLQGEWRVYEEIDTGDEKIRLLISNLIDTQRDYLIRFGRANSKIDEALDLARDLKANYASFDKNKLEKDIKKLMDLIRFGKL